MAKIDRDLVEDAGVATPLSRPEVMWPIVGIGASAGGLDALRSFFGRIPAACGATFIVVQHLSPNFKSAMANILARYTPMPVLDIEDGMALKQDVVLMAPPRSLVSFDKDGSTLRLAGANREKTIDHLFNAIAETAGTRAIAIILSGTGDDGSRGLRAVAEAGGLVLAQEAATAEFEAMPLNAQATGLVDLVGAIDDLPELVVELAGNPERRLRPLRMPGDTKGRGGELETVLGPLRRSRNVDFSEYKPLMLLRRIRHRMQTLAIEQIADYGALIEADEGELAQLHRDLLIGVSRFRRDSGAFDHLDRYVIPRLANRVEADQPIRIWVPGCATGQEPFTLAMLFADALDRRELEHNFQIFATDVDERAIQFCRKGIYDGDQLADLPDAWRERYVEENDGQGKIVNTLRKRVAFSRHNLLKDPPLSHLDLISCRNLVIYFSPEAQQRVFQRFAAALDAGGYLFLGPSEGLGTDENVFISVSHKWSIYRKRDQKAEVAPRSVPRPTFIGSGTTVAAPRTQADVDGLIEPALLRAYDDLLNQYAPDSLLVDQNGALLHCFGESGRFLKPLVGRPSNQLTDLVEGQLRLALSATIDLVASDRRGRRLEGIATGEQGPVDLIFQPIYDHIKQTCFVLIVFDQGRSKQKGDVAVWSMPLDKMLSNRVSDLEDQLAFARAHLRETVAKLETSNEQLQAANEELMSANEELQSTNEELHAVNEELYTLNAAHLSKIAELEELTADVDNLLRSSDIATVFVNEKLEVRENTPAAAKAFNLLPQDIGRSISDITHHVDYDLTTALRQCVEAGDTTAATVRNTRGGWWLMRILPYRKGDGQIAGAVMTFTDISDLKHAEQELIVQRERLQFTLANSPAVIYSRRSEPPFAFVSVGPNTEAKLGLNESDLLKGPEGYRDRIHADDLPAVADALGKVDFGSDHSVDYRYGKCDGEIVWLRDTMRKVTLEGTGTSNILGVLTDITDYRTAQEALEASEERYKRLIESAPDAILIHKGGVITLANRQAAALFEADNADGLIGKPLLDLIPEANRPALRGQFDASSDRAMGDHVVETRLSRRDGSLVELEVTSAIVREPSGPSVQSVLRDITDRKRAEDQIRRLVNHDPLTGLPNRTLLLDRLRQAIASCLRRKCSVAVMMLDLDAFKDVNDTLGHPTGDKLLCNVAERLSGTVRASDTLARLGGDEFAIVQTDIKNADGAAVLANKVVALLTEPFDIDGHEVHTGVSVGVAMYPVDGDDPDTLIKHADLALYAAKSKGGSQVEFFVRQMNADVQARKSLETDLRRAIDQGELSVVLQPQYSLQDNVCVGAEVLVRWNHPKRGPVAPRFFVPVAEATGLIRPLGRFVLDEACRIAARWAANGWPLSFAVNLSAAQVKHGDLIQTLKTMLDRHQIKPASLELEITESLLFEPSNEALAHTIREIADLGIKLSIDDFGTGYSSLAYLKRFPIDKIKIDQSFVRDIGLDNDDEAIVEAIVGLGHSLGKRVIAEGVETDSQLEFLRKLGCDQAQGFHLGRPVEESLLFEHLTNGRD